MEDSERPEERAPKQPVPRERGSRAAPMLYSRLADALDALSLYGEDRLEATEAVAEMGDPDSALGERIGADRCSVDEAALEPPRRSVGHRDEATKPVYHARTFLLPSGRVLQLQRRFVQTRAWPQSRCGSESSCSRRPNGKLSGAVN